MNYLDLRRSEKRMLEIKIDSLEYEIKRLAIREKRIRRDLANPDNINLMPKVVMELGEVVMEIESLKMKRHMLTDRRVDILVDIYETEMQLAYETEKEKI